MKLSLDDQPVKIYSLYRLFSVVFFWCNALCSFLFGAPSVPSVFVCSLALELNCTSYDESEMYFSEY